MSFTDPARSQSPAPDGTADQPWPRYGSIAEFYMADDRRRLSGEVDYGVMWTDPGRRWPQYRVSFVDETGELYALRLAPGGGPDEWLEVIARFVNREEAEHVLAGWVEACTFGGMEWLRARCRAHTPGSYGRRHDGGRL